MADELKLYTDIMQQLNSCGARTYVYGNEGFMPLGHKKRFDILIFGIKNKNIGEPIGLEVKDREDLYSVTSALHDQIEMKYQYRHFLCQKENWQGKPAVLAFTNRSAFTEGILYKKKYPEASNFFIERFAWRMDIGILVQQNGKFWLSYKNSYHDLFSDTTIKIGKDGAV